MTKDKNWKQRVRAFADETGMRYAAAHRVLLARQVQNSAVPTGKLPIAEHRFDVPQEGAQQLADSRTASRGRTKPPHLAPILALDYVRACTLAKQVYGLLVNTSELAWQIYGVRSPQGRDGDQILSKGQYLKNLLRADALDEGVPKGAWHQEEDDEKVYRRYYPIPKWLSKGMSEQDQVAYRGRGRRGRCPKAMPVDAHQAVARAHLEAAEALSHLEALLAPHHQHPGTFLRLKACQRLAKLARRQQTAFRAALDAEHGTASSPSQDQGGESKEHRSMALQRTLTVAELSKMIDYLTAGAKFGQIQTWLKSIGLSVQRKKDIGVLYELSKRQIENCGRT